MSNLLFNTSTPSLGEFLGNGSFFIIPDFQRDYTWGEDNWQELWNDSISAWRTEKSHFMGCLVLQEQPNKYFTIIDGQQRTLTFSIFIIAILDLFDKSGFSEIAEIIRNKYIGEKNIAENLNFKIKVTVSQKDQAFYYGSLATKIKAPTSIKFLPKSQQRMWQCYEFFTKELKDYFIKDGIFDKDLLINFFDSGLAERLLFIRIGVKDELSAFTLFETLNGTGLKLTTGDMIKNHLFSMTYTVNDIFRLTKSKWESIVSNINESEFSDFLRYFWTATRQKITKNNLLKEIKNEIKTSEQVVSLLEELDSFAEIYSALSDSDSQIWDDEQRECIYILSKLFKNKQYKILMLVAKIRLTSQDFGKLLKNLIAFIFRFQEIASLSPNKLETLYSKIAIDLYSKKINTYSEVKELLKELYIPDNKFRADFENWEIDKVKMIRYVLIKIENQITGGDRSIFENESVEHILPQKPSDVWADFGQARTIEQNIYKLGNLTLLEKTKNREIGNISFADKKLCFEKSNYKITKDIVQEENWDQNAVIKRQKAFARIAQTIWRID